MVSQNPKPPLPPPLRNGSLATSVAVLVSAVVGVHLSITQAERKRDLKPKSNLENSRIQTTNQNSDKIRSKDSKPTTNPNIKTQTS